MQKRFTAARQARGFLILIAFLFASLVLASWYLDSRALEEEYRNLAAEMGRSFFMAIDAMRDWNLAHGGIYVKAAADVPPSPYLPESLRSAITARGEKLTLVSHAHMTRLISELLSNQRGIHLHISSLAPIRPGNAPDAWERHALAHFAQGSSEEYDVIGKGDQSDFRYMAPLLMQSSCLACHQKQEVNDGVRGGISVSFSYAPFVKVMAAERRRMLLIDCLLSGVGLAIIAVTGRKLVQNIVALQDSLIRIKRLEGLLPICAHCKKIRLEGADRTRSESWIAVEKYIADRTDAAFTHGLCPSCAREFYPEHYPGRPG
jgi:hypothetical protein